MKKRNLIIFFAGLCTPLIAAFLFLISGGMPVATKGPPLPFEQTIAKTALHAKMGNQDSVRPGVEVNEMNLSLGAKVYLNNCAVCHGLPNEKPTAIAEGLFPKPPQLFSADESVTDDSPGKIYWKVKNGIRLTGMPGFVDTLTDAQLWQVSLLLQQADKLPENTKKTLKH